MTGRRVHLVRRDLIFAAVREAGRISRADLVRRTGMARMTVNGLVAELLTAGVLAEEAAAHSGTRAGRPARSLTLGPAAGGVVGALIGADGVRVAEADLAGNVLRERHHDIDTSDPSTALDAIAEVITGTGRIWSTVAGFSAPISGGVIQSSSVLPGWAGTSPAAELGRRLGHRVIVRNDADLSLLGEVGYGVAAGHQDVCYLRVATGIGCGLLLGGTVHHGATGVAGEIGHVQVDETGALCQCGNRGCLETIASPRQILAALSAGYGSPVTASQAVELARTDATAERILADAGRMIGRVVAALANGINPSLVVLDGPLITPDGPILAGVTESLHRYAQPEVVESTAVRVSALGGRAALLGAVGAALRVTPAARGERAFLPMPAASEAGPAVPSPGRRERLVRRDMILDALRGQGPTARSDLVKITRLPRAAVVELLAELRHEGLVELCAPVETRAGRPSPHFRLTVGSGRLIGIALALPGIRAVVADGAGRIEETMTVPFPMSNDSHPMLRAAGDLARELLDRHGPEARIAVSVPAPVHPRTGRFGVRSVLPMFSGFAPAEEIAAAVGRPVRVENNAQLAALAEMRRGAARGAQDVLYLKADQHTGAGIVVGGRMHRGAIGYAGEVGHLNVREIGPFCICGSRGCLSAFLSPAYFGALIEPRPAAHSPGAPGSPVPPGSPVSKASTEGEDRLLTLAAQGHRPAQRALLDAGRLIGRTVAPLCDVLNPAVVVVGGRFVEAGAFVVEGIREALLRHSAPSAAAGLTVVRAELGFDAEALGAVELLL
ncbi:putative NBD/HSP70 family sugar kinase [Actinoplanes lutulentus]|uniref:Putative NBD/HSP70 family sugar kinase n=1 Tax=Actinoplanes lutulentus TaxID=1287878 RepID=A0A327ZFP4_9ACTN|nr:ROK family protein [Actinoplanes lutulentus]MBB2941683.1 putative NBD/HSP70 family sugar kinase [Actinoplanes lutulentus]RAK39603.1 putative NBD/HSP70 family sugar kinase [Actinoplanes lutulentus]